MEKLDKVPKGKSKQSETAKNKHKDQNLPAKCNQNASPLILHVVLHGLALNIAFAVVFARFVLHLNWP